MFCVHFRSIPEKCDVFTDLKYAVYIIIAAFFLGMEIILTILELQPSLSA